MEEDGGNGLEGKRKVRGGRGREREWSGEVEKGEGRGEGGHDEGLPLLSFLG